ncbi:MAG: hypothetical protein GY817_05120 [bacterium]|nr:hypothetical protein [bacterium]
MTKRGTLHLNNGAVIAVGRSKAPIMMQENLQNAEMVTMKKRFLLPSKKCLSLQITDIVKVWFNRIFNVKFPGASDSIGKINGVTLSQFSIERKLEIILKNTAA